MKELKNMHNISNRFFNKYMPGQPKNRSPSPFSKISKATVYYRTTKVSPLGSNDISPGLKVPIRQIK
jgi:hypothetical protein